MKKYTEEFIVPCYESDLNMIMTPNAFLDHAQEIAQRNAQELGFGRDDLIKNNTAWVLSRIHVKFHKLPHWRDEVNMKTWHKSTDTLYYFRDFTMHDNMGNLLASATTSWLVIDLESRRLTRSQELARKYEKCLPEDAIVEVAPKLKMPRDVEPEEVYVHHVRYTDIDVNGHVNNVKYAVWSMDAVPYEIVSKRQVKDLKINFNHEAKLNDDVQIFRTMVETEDGGLLYTIEGRVQDKVSFITELEF